MGLGITRLSIVSCVLDDTGDSSQDAIVKVRRIVNRRGQSFCDITNWPFLRHDLSFSIVPLSHTYSGASYLPTTFKRVIAAYLLDGTDRLPLKEVGINRSYEWGNPNEKEDYEYMISYSPYDNVEAKDYPAMLVTTGLYDSQVQYWEPAKWVAKLRDMKTDHNLLLLHTNMEAGHGGASGRFERYRETALEYAFMFKLLGIRK